MPAASSEGCAGPVRAEEAEDGVAQLRTDTDTADLGLDGRHHPRGIEGHGQFRRDPRGHPVASVIVRKVVGDSTTCLAGTVASRSGTRCR